MIPFVSKVGQEPLKTCHVRSFPCRYLIGYEIGAYGCPLPSLVKKEIDDHNCTIHNGRMTINIYDQRINKPDEKILIGTLKFPIGKETGREVASRRDLGVSVEGFALPSPNVRSVSNAANGALKRVLGRVGVPQKRTLRRFRSFVRLLLRKNYTPLEP